MKGLARTRGDDCVSDLAFDRLLGGELTEAEAGGVRAHLVACDRCGARHDELVRDREAFAESHGGSAPADRSAGEPPAHVVPLRRWLGAASVSLALAAAVLLWLRGRQFEGEDYGTRLKGGGSVSFYVGHGDEVRRGSPGESLHAGDRVQFVVALLEPRYVAVLSRDGRGAASVFYPEGDRAERVEAGPAVRLPQSTVLDDAPGREDVHALFCTTAVELEPVRASLEARGTLDAPPGCEARSFHWSKELAR